MSQPDELLARLSRDERFDWFNAEMAEKMIDGQLYDLLEEAQADVLKDTHCRVKEQEITLSSDTRSVNLPDDFMIEKDFRYKESGDDALLEGREIIIVDQEELP